MHTISLAYYELPDEGFCEVEGGEHGIRIDGRLVDVPTAVLDAANALADAVAEFRDAQNKALAGKDGE